jgi:hypothetical protein
MTFHVPEACRIRTGSMASSRLFGNNGAFRVPYKLNPVPFMVIVSDGIGWEHVSVSLPNRCPTWDEMCFIKSVFWDDTDCVVQYHPPASEYVNCHPFCLHLWRPVGMDFPMPPSIMVGPKND